MSNSNFTANLREIATCPSEDILNRIALKHIGENHPTFHQYIGGRYSHFFHNPIAAKRHFIAGARLGLRYPCSFWNDQEIDSIGYCIAALTLNYLNIQNKDEKLEHKLHRLAYIYSSRYIEKFGIRSPESFSRRGCLLQKFGPSSFSTMENLGKIHVVQAVSDFYLSSIGWIHLNEPEAARQEHSIAIRLHEWLEDITVAGKDADEYDLEEISLVGRQRNGELYDYLQKEFKLGNLDIDTIEFEDYVTQLSNNESDNFTV